MLTFVFFTFDDLQTLDGSRLKVDGNCVWLVIVMLRILLRCFLLVELTAFTTQYYIVDQGL